MLVPGPGDVDTYVENGVHSRHMYQRLCKPLKSNSFFLFGPRGSGKSSLLKALFSEKNCLWIDLLESDVYRQFLQRPELLDQQARAKKWDWVIIDEVQKVPSLLDQVHKLIEDKKAKFILTGSSARKLKRASANLLAGRAFVNTLHPFTSWELGDDFNLENVLNWGSLPQLTHYSETAEFREYLKAYVHTYIKEEIKEEQVVRNIEPFVKFLEVAAQMNGKIINYSKISRDSGTNSKAVERYYEILSDTLIGFFLEPFHRSVRKRQIQHAKFYFFDLGVTKSLAGQLTVPTQEGTVSYGDAFEHFFILECIRLNDYLKKDFKFSYLRTKDDLEIDLIVDRPGKKRVLIEIKSSKLIDSKEILKMTSIKEDLKPCEFWFVCREKVARTFEGFIILPWDEALQRLFDN
jgi:uncharacterized protein